MSTQYCEDITPEEQEKINEMITKINESITSSTQSVVPEPIDQVDSVN